jgi:hypothetical protein
VFRQRNAHGFIYKNRFGVAYPESALPITNKTMQLSGCLRVERFIAFALKEEGDRIW